MRTPDINKHPILISEKAKEVAKELLQTLTLQEKIGQLFMPMIKLDEFKESEIEIKGLIEQYHIGGIMYYKGDAKILVKIFNAASKLTTIPLFFSIDGETGLATRLKDTIRFPQALTIGSIVDSHLIEEYGRVMARQCKRLGININFAPIIDKYDTYMGQFSITWGQCWTRESWLKFKTWYINQKVSLGNNEYLPQKINRWPQQSWGKYFITYIVAMDKYYVIPRISLSTNFSEIGEDVQAQDSDHQVRLLYDNKQMFNFAPFEFAEKYDVFFENTRLQSQFPSEMSIEGIDIDLNGEGRRNINNRYVLTTLVLPYKIINSYGLVLRPIEMNIIKAVQGNDIYLYDTHICAKKKASNIDRIYRYEVRGISLFKLFEYIINAAIIKLKKKNKK